MPGSGYPFGWVYLKNLKSTGAIHGDKMNQGTITIHVDDVKKNHNNGPQDFYSLGATSI